ncbi:hypothetical protein U1Q18_048155 [Sarracenia purpurea var. burkii]
MKPSGSGGSAVAGPPEPRGRQASAGAMAVPGGVGSWGLFNENAGGIGGPVLGGGMVPVRSSEVAGGNYGLFLRMGENVKSRFGEILGGNENADVGVDPVLSWFNEFNDESGGSTLYGGLIPGQFGEVVGGNAVQGGRTGEILGRENGLVLCGGEEIERHGGTAKGIGGSSLGAGGGPYETVSPNGNKRRRPKSLNSKKKDLDGVEIVRPKAKMGRPKGSKNKKKVLDSREIPGINAFSIFAVEGNIQGQFIDPRQGNPPENKEIQSQTVEIAGGSGAKDEVIEWKKDGRGRPKGSNKRKIHGAEEIREMSIELAGGNNGIVMRKIERRGRPKGSKNRKKKVLAIEGNQEMSFEFGSGSVCGNDTVTRKNGRGRPKGSKNRKKICATEGKSIEFDSCTVDLDTIFKRKDGRGRPKGSKNKKRKLGRSKGSTNKWEVIVSANESGGIFYRNDGGDDGRLDNTPQLLENGEPILGANTDWSEAGKFAYEDHGGYENVASDSKSEEDQILSANVDGVQVTETVKRKRGRPKGYIINKKRKRGRPKGYKNKKSQLIIGGEILSCSNEEGKDLVMSKDAGELLAGSSNSQKKRRGRPRKYTDDGSNPISTSEQIFTGEGKSNSVSSSEVIS